VDDSILIELLAPIVVGIELAAEERFTDARKHDKTSYERQ